MSQEDVYDLNSLYRQFDRRREHCSVLKRKLNSFESANLFLQNFSFVAGKTCIKCDSHRSTVHIDRTLEFSEHVPLSLPDECVSKRLMTIIASTAIDMAFKVHVNVTNQSLIGVRLKIHSVEIFISADCKLHIRVQIVRTTIVSRLLRTFSKKF